MEVGHKREQHKCMLCTLYSLLCHSSSTAAVQPVRVLHVECCAGPRSLYSSVKVGGVQDAGLCNRSPTACVEYEDLNPYRQYLHLTLRRSLSATNQIAAGLSHSACCATRYATSRGVRLGGDMNRTSINLLCNPFQQALLYRQPSTRSVGQPHSIVRLSHNRHDN